MNYLTTGTPWQVAAGRALLSAAIAGGLAFLAVWSQTDDVKTLVTAGLVPFLSVLSTRLGLEGYVDTQRGKQK